MQAEAKKIIVDIVTDFACPWCYVGLKRFQAGCAKFSSSHPSIPVEVKYHPYMIDLGTKPNGEEYLAYNKRRWGGDGWTHSLRSSSLQDGCTFKKWVWWANTLNAHQLLCYAEQFGKQVQVMEVLLRKSYEDGLNISLKETVVEAADELGINEGGGAATWVGSKEGIQEVKERDRQAKAQDIGGVPFFMIKLEGGSATSLEGAQNPATFLKAFNSLIK